MNKVLLVSMSLVTLSLANAQVGIGTLNPHSSSILDIESTQKGFLPPRVASTNLITDPAEGLVVYDESDNCLNVWNDSEWVNICEGLTGGGTTPPTTSNSIVGCEAAGLINPKQIETAYREGLTNAMAITSNDELWVFGYDNVNISNRSFQFPAGYSGPDNAQAAVSSIYSGGYAHRISTPNNNSMIPTKIIAAQYTSGSSWVNISNLPGNIHYLVEFDNGQQWWYAHTKSQTGNTGTNAAVDFGTSASSGINGTAPNSPLLCGDDLTCSNLSSTQLGGTALSNAQKAEKYSWVRLVTPSGTKVVNVFGSNTSGVTFLLDDGRVVNRKNQNNWYTNLPTIAGHKITQMGFLPKQGSVPDETLFFLYSNGDLYSINQPNFTGTPTSRDANVRELAVTRENQSGAMVYYTKDDKGLYGVHSLHPNLNRKVSNTNDVEYFTTASTYDSESSLLTYYSTSNEVKAILDQGALGGQSGVNSSAFLPSSLIFGTNTSVNLNVVPLAIDNIDFVTGNTAATPNDALNVKWTTGVKRVIYNHGTLHGILTNEVFVNANNNGALIPENPQMKDLNYTGKVDILRNCLDVQYPFVSDALKYDFQGETFGN
ncbi:MAG: hypothetical protein ACPG6V_08750 [Flavobacteriales bacterium]